MTSTFFGSKLIGAIVGLSVFCSLAWSQVQTEQFDENNPLTITASFSTNVWNVGQSGELKLDLRLPPGYRAYEDQFKLVIFEPDGFKSGDLKISPISEWDDKFLKKRKKGIIGSATAKVLIEAPHRFNKNYTRFKAELTYQACSDQFCLFPTTKTFEIPIQLIGVENTASLNVLKESDPQKPLANKPSFLSSESFQDWLSLGILPSLLFVFLAGVLTSFTPCIFPMIPITLAVLGHHAEKRTRLQNFFYSLTYVLGIATTYSLFGVLAALGGGVFGASLGNPFVLAGICLLLFAMALSMYGLFEIQMPAFIRNKIGSKKTKANPIGAYLTGLFAGIVASPCVGPVLVAILTYVSVTKNAFLGFILLFTYALGLGLIFLVLGVYSELAKKLPRSGPWMDLFKFSLGSLMLGAFYYYLGLLIPSRWHDIALGLGLVIVASAFGAFMSSKNTLHHIRKGMMQAILFVGFAYLTIGVLNLRPYIYSQLVGSASINQKSKIEWKAYSEVEFQKAVEIGKPIVIDFWAEWCAACHEMEEKTFTDPVIESLASNFTFLKFDATKDSPELQALKKKYGIQGLPTILFFDKSGIWQSRLTLTQFEEPRDFSLRLQEAIK